MGCNTCDDKNGACDLNVRKLLGGRTPVRDPADYTPNPIPPAPANVPGASTGFPPVPGGGCGCSTNANGGGGWATSNCMFGPPDETTCQRQKRQLKYENSVETASGEIDQAGPLPHFVTAKDLGFSPYLEEGTNGNGDNPVRFMLNVPTHELTACDFICEFKVRWTRPSTEVGEPDVVVYEGPANMVQGRSSYHATENNIAFDVSQANGAQFGSRVLTHDGHCACACVKLWHTYDLPGQVEFTVPGITDGSEVEEDDKFEVTYQVTRVYIASKECDFPERCGEDIWADISAGG